MSETLYSNNEIGTEEKYSLMIIKDILQHDSSQGSINSIQRLVKFDTNLCKFATNTPENAKLKRWGVFIVSFEYLFLHSNVYSLF